MNKEILSNSEVFSIVIVIALVTFALRLMPFVLFGRKKDAPNYILWLGDVLPYALIGMLVVYCLKNINLSIAPHGLPEIIASLIVVAIHLLLRNTLLSVGVGTIFYMLLVQYVF